MKEEGGKKKQRAHPVRRYNENDPLLFLRSFMSETQPHQPQPQQQQHGDLHMLSIPIPKPEINRGMININIVVAPACSAAPIVKSKAPTNKVGFRP